MSSVQHEPHNLAGTDSKDKRKALPVMAQS